ncbi:hypothetical protein [Shinella pollutisoli]|uniref:Uncharacterized protein n=1 Tax=Shinella pollutisoli TaxID=2250594 RepID=A0ABV7DMT7_9HYPH|nr:hypothetical protein [Shinella pollutisoli]
MDGTAESDIPLVDLDDMILHDEVLERYPWLSGHILQRWRRERKIRSFTGKEGKLVYPKSGLCWALTAEMAAPMARESTNEPCPQEEPAERREHDSSEAERIRRRLSYESIFGREKAAALFSDD